MESKNTPTENKKKDNKPEIITKDKTSEEIIDQEIRAILKIWPNDYVMIEHNPLKQIKIFMEYSINKQLEIHFIYPSLADVGEEMLYPNSCVVVKLKSKVMPHKLIETLLKKSENMIKKLALTP